MVMDRSIFNPHDKISSFLSIKVNRVESVNYPKILVFSLFLYYT